MRLLLMLALVITATPALAWERRSKDPNKMVCIKEAIVGSRLATKRICKTQRDWDQEKADARQMLERAVNTQTNPQG